MDIVDVFAERINIFFGISAAVLAVFFGDHWLFFAAFFALNVVDFATGWAKSRCAGTEKSSKGAQGAAKKVGYWVIIGIAFFVGVSCVELGKLIGMNLGFLTAVGYFTLATYIINEIRSIIENLVVMKVPVPDYLTRGLAIADKLVNDAAALKTLKDERDGSEVE